jgi:hypothetical protein
MSYSDVGTLWKLPVPDSIKMGLYDVERGDNEPALEAGRMPTQDPVDDPTLQQHHH